MKKLLSILLLACGGVPCNDADPTAEDCPCSDVGSTRFNLTCRKVCGEDDRFSTKESTLAWMNANQHDADHQRASVWTRPIYGDDAFNRLGAGGVWTQLYQDIEKMTAAEFEAFRMGTVPAWMGLGTAASGSEGGGFMGLNAGDQGYCQWRT